VFAATRENIISFVGSLIFSILMILGNKVSAQVLEFSGNHLLANKIQFALNYISLVFFKEKVMFNLSGLATSLPFR
jgi:hypothetical protein